MPTNSRALRHALRGILSAAALSGGLALAQEPSSPTSSPLVVPAAATTQIPEPPSAALAQAPAAAGGRAPHVLGLQLGAGVPEGGSATVLYRPWKNLRFGGSFLYNYVGYGLAGSVSVLPYFPVAPSLTLEVGHFFEANASSKLAQFTTVEDNLQPLLNRVGYTFASAQLGLEIGHPNWFVFFVRAGISRVWVRSSDADKVLVTTSDGTLTFTDPSARLGIPNAKAGFMLFFY